MRKLVGTVLALVLVSGMASATLVTVVVPDPSPQPYIFYGQGDASVTYSGVLFTQQLALGNAFLFDVGPLFSGDPAVLSSPEANVGVENILVTLPNPTSFFSVDYGTFNGSAVTFVLSNGQTFIQGSTGSGYLTPDFFSFSDAPLTSVEITSPDFVLNINNISYNSGTTVPEPGTLFMLGSGIIGLAGVLRRKINL
jgi:PEP-CTERM motif